MAKSSKEAHGAAGQGNLLLFDPETLVLVTDKASPLYDERVHLPLDESMVLNIKAFGVIEPIVVTKNRETGLTEVVAGRQRVKHAIEANRRLAAEGLKTIRVPGVVRGGTGLQLAGVMASENEQRKADTPLGRAQKMRHMIDTLGATDDDLMLTFGVTGQTIKTLLQLLDSPAAVRSAVDSGKIGLVHAKKLVGLPADQQREKVAALVAAHDSSNGHERARKQRAVVDTGPKMRGKKEITAERDNATGERRAALDWVLGVSP